MNSEYSCKRFPPELDLAPMRSASIIAIDGDNGAGKTRLAQELCRDLNGTHVEIDQFLSGNGTPYLEQIDKLGIVNCIEYALNFPIILDGVFMLDVLDAIGKKADYLIFGRYISRNGREVDQYLPANTSLPKSPFTKQLVTYYRNRSPWLIADQTYEMRRY
jgi:hypothetical protein